MDEIIARFIQPMASHARDIINFKNYMVTDGGKRDVIERKLYEEKKKAPSRYSMLKDLLGSFVFSRVCFCSGDVLCYRLGVRLSVR